MSHGNTQETAYFNADRKVKLAIPKGKSFFRRLLFVLLGLVLGGFVGFAVIIAVLEFIFPMFGWTDEMSVGIGGFLLLVYFGPVFMIGGGVIAFLFSRKRPRKQRTPQT